MKSYSLLLLLFVGMLTQLDFAYCDDASDDEDMNYYLNRLYDATSDEGQLDPHDMLAYPGRKSKPPTAGSFSSTKPVEDSVTPQNMVKGIGSPGCAFENKIIEDYGKQLYQCQTEITSLDQSLQKERQRSAGLEKKLMKEGKEDMGVFYKRSVLHFWKILKMKEVSELLHDESSAVIRHISVRIQKSDADNFQTFIDTQSNALKIDEFLEHSFKTIAPAETWKFDVFAWLSHTYHSLTAGIKNIEVWLNILCGGFLFLGIWAILLFIKDIQNELRWMRVLWMMLFLVFCISCLWHWRHLHKQAEARRHASFAKRGYSDVPDECRPGARSDPASVLDWIKIKVFGAPDVCQKYYEEMMIDTMEEISPSMVIAEALAKFILQPLQLIGTHCGQLFSNFFAQVPVVYQVQAGIMFIILIVVILLVTCGYGIDFPFWLGGIRPHYRPDVAEKPDVNQITREALEILRADRDRFMQESQTMLMDITRAVSQTQVGVGVQPLLLTSGNIIETQLERLISQRLSNVIKSPVSSEAPTESAQVLPAITHQNIGNYQQVDTVTSTPLRTSYIRQPTETVDGPIPSSGIKVKPDAIHYRLKGEPRQKHNDKEGSQNNRLEDQPENNSSFMPPPSPLESSPSYAVRRKPLLVNNKEGSQNNRPEDQSGDDSSFMPPPSPIESSPGCAVRRRKPLFVKQPRNCSSISIDNQTLENHTVDIKSPLCSNNMNDSYTENLDASSTENLDASNISEVFVEKVKNLLEESANSSMNASRDEGGILNTSTRNESLKHSINQVPDRKHSQEEEFEFSAHGQSFLNEVESAITP